MDIDSYQPATEAHLPSRKRRPWWRWNLITLAIVLFVLLWTRELLQFDPSSVWLSAGTIIFLWTIIPIPWATSMFTTMPDYSDVPPREKIINRRTFFVACRILAFVLAFAAVCSGCMYIYSAMNFASRGNFRLSGTGVYMVFQIANMFAQSLFHFAIAAVLWLLVEAIEKLDYVMSELRTQAKRTGSGE